MKLKNSLIITSVISIIGFGIWAIFIKSPSQAPNAKTTVSKNQAAQENNHDVGQAFAALAADRSKAGLSPYSNKSPSELTPEEIAHIDRQILEYSDAIKANGNDKIALFGRASLYTQKGFYDEAVADYSSLIRLDEKDIKAYFYRAIAQAQRNNIIESLADYNKVISLDPKSVVAYDNRGLLYLNKRDFSKAQSDFEKVMSLDPQYAPAYYNRAFISLEAKNFADAEKDLLKAIELCDPTNQEFQIKVKYRLAVALYNQGKYQEALTPLNEIIKLSPKESKFYTLRAITHDQLGNRQQAFEDRNKAQELNLNNML